MKLVAADLAIIVVLGIAAYRATRVFTKDTITDDLRAQLYRWAWDDPGPPHEPEARSTARSYIYEGLTCPFCLGVWAALVLTWMWRGLPWHNWQAGTWLMCALAIAGVQAFIASRDDA